MIKKSLFLGTYDYIIVILMLLCSNSVYVTHVYEANAVDFLFKLFILLSLFINLTTILAQRKLNKKLLLLYIYFILFCLLICVIYILINPYIRNDGSDTISFIIFRFFLLPLSFLLMLSKKGLNQNKYYLNLCSNVVFILCALSLIMFLLGTVFNIIHANGIFYSNWVSPDSVVEFPSFYNIHFITQNNEFLGFKMIRNTGIYPEAPMFSLPISIAFLYELFYKNKPNKCYIFTFIITIFTTMATTGILIVIVFLTIYIIFFIKKNVYLRMFMYLILPLALCLVFYLILMIMIEKSSGGSYGIRNDDYIAGLKAWSDSIWIGNGIGNFESIVKYMSSFRSHNLGYSNSIMLVLANGGIVLFLYYLIPLIMPIIINVRNNNYKKPLFFMGIFILFCVTIFQYTPIMFFLLSIGYIDSVIKNETHKKLSL